MTVSSSSCSDKSTRVFILRRKSYFSVLPLGNQRILNTHCPRNVFASLSSIGIGGSFPANICLLNSSNFLSMYCLSAFINHFSLDKQPISFIHPSAISGHLAVVPGCRRIAIACLPKGNICNEDCFNPLSIKALYIITLFIGDTALSSEA